MKGEEDNIVVVMTLQTLLSPLFSFTIDKIYLKCEVEVLYAIGSSHSRKNMGNSAIPLDLTICVASAELLENFI